ncbi:MAG TPA: DUF3857 and transglutaminase domain-containing protein [Bacteroidales bacterium]|nr:DUF3857 and transglutaminase domain-containing protein [Bacteroidales bacterium]
MRSLLTFIILTYTSLFAYAQAPKEKWGSATTEELSMAFCSLDPAADAAYLDKYGHYYFNRHYYFSVQELRTIYHYQNRVKIFTEAGKKYATISIPFRGYDEYEDVIEITGTTYNLENGKVVKSKMKQKNIKWEKNGRNMWNCTFTLPDVKAGSVIEYSYKIASLDFLKLRDWMFQTDIPVLNSNMTLTTPHFFQFAFFSNIPSFKMEVNRTESNEYIQFYNTNIYVFSNSLHLRVKNIPAFKKEVLMPDSARQIYKGEFLLSLAMTRPSDFANIRDYYLMPYLKPLLLTTTEDYYEIQERISLYNDLMAGFKIIEGMDWEAFIKKLSKQDDFGKAMMKAFDNKSLIDSFRRVEVGRKRMIAIYDFVRTYMKWNGQYRIFASSSLEKVFERKTGYSSDINMLLINLLTRSGIQARPVLISTRSYGDVYKEMAFVKKFNHVIVSVELDGKRYLLDATDPLRPYDLLSTDDLNGEGLLVNLLEYQWIPLINPSVSALHQSENYTISSEGRLHTEVTSTLNGQFALQKRKEILRSSDNEKLNIENLSNFDSPLILKTDKQENISRADSLVFAPLALNSPIENFFVDEQRTQPVDMEFERIISREITITIPEGYTLSSYPADESITSQGDFISCSLTSSLEQNTLKMKLNVELKNSFIPPQFYPDLKLFFAKLKQLENNPVTLRLTKK